MNQKIDLLDINFKEFNFGITTEIKIRIYKEEKNIFDYIFFRKTKFIQGEYIFTYSTDDFRIKDENNKLVKGKLNEILSIFRDLFLEEPLLSDYIENTKKLPKKSFYIELGKLERTDFGGYLGVYAYDDFQDAPLDYYK